jgi:7-cyano-7-deazaguanine synthase in queuosine biosynthesis
MADACIHVRGRADPLLIRINGEAPTFVLESDRIAAAALSPLPPELLDLLEIAAFVFAADGSVRRGGATRPRMGEGWRRRFDFEVPVRRPDIWSSEGMREALTDAIGFLTEDEVSFQFLQAQPEPPAAQPYFDFDAGEAAFRADEIIMFSGGLDSFAGALDCLSSTSSNVVLVTHRSAQKAIPRQVELGRYLSDRFRGRVLHLNLRAHRIGKESRDYDQRSRSFLFAALGQAVAQQFGARHLSFYENGIMSHNLPISRQIVGTMASRTTHPLALTLLDRVMQEVGAAPARLANRFQWLTKTEVVRRIAESQAERQIPRAVSCTSIREQNSLHTHCGACTQCLDRRFALLAAGLAAHDPDEIYLTDVLLGPRETTKSRTMATEWLRHSLLLGQLDQGAFLEIHGSELARILRGHPGVQRAEILGRTLDMHHRHSRAVREALEQAIRDQATKLADKSLPVTSLLRLQLGDDSSDSQVIADDPRLERQPDAHGPQDHDVDDTEDLVLDPDAPLVVSFLFANGRPVVSVAGLGTITGRPALVPHALRPTFEDDRANGLSPDEHRFTRSANLLDLQSMSKDAVRANVARCRKSLAEDFTLIHGRPPSRDLLIEGKQAQGYRLDPTIRTLDESL